MDITVYLLLLAEAVLALALLHLSGVLKKPWHVLLSAGLLAFAFVLRGICLDYVDGEPIRLEDAEINVELPPYHPNCACSFVSWEEIET